MERNLRWALDLFYNSDIPRCQTKGTDYASAASDMFSLGVVIYMLVSGGYEPFWDGSDIRFTVNYLNEFLQKLPI